MSAVKKSMSVITRPDPVFAAPVIKTRQPDGSILIKAGRLEIVPDEVTVAEFHRETRVSKRYIAELCEQGLIQHRRLTPKKDSKILIPRSEIDRYRNLHADAGHVPKTPTDDLAGKKASANASGASYPIARRGSPALKSFSNHQPNP